MPTRSRSPSWHSAVSWALVRGVQSWRGGGEGETPGKHIYYLMVSRHTAGPWLQVGTQAGNVKIRHGARIPSRHKPWARFFGVWHRTSLPFSRVLISFAHTTVHQLMTLWHGWQWCHVLITCRRQPPARSCPHNSQQFIWMFSTNCLRTCSTIRHPSRSNGSHLLRDNVVYWKTKRKIKNDLHTYCRIAERDVGNSFPGCR